MNKNDLDKLVRWTVDSNLRLFAEDSYGVSGTAFDVANGGDYLVDKFKQMQTNFIMWLAGLSDGNRTRLARNITFNMTEEEQRKEIHDIGVQATKIIMSNNKKGEII